MQTAFFASRRTNTMHPLPLSPLFRQPSQLSLGSLFISTKMNVSLLFKCSLAVVLFAAVSVDLIWRPALDREQRAVASANQFATVMETLIISPSTVQI